MSKRLANVVNVDDVREVVHTSGEHSGGGYKVLTPTLDELGGRLGVNITRLPPRMAACPFHAHQREDEVFFILSGRCILRYGEDLQELGQGDCVSCAAGTGVAHQLFNPFDEDAMYLCAGVNYPHEVVEYPDSGKIMVRSLKRIGFMEDAEYDAGEPERPRVLELYEQKTKARKRTRGATKKRKVKKSTSKTRGR